MATVVPQAVQGPAHGRFRVLVTWDTDTTGPTGQVPAAVDDLAGRARGILGGKACLAVVAKPGQTLAPGDIGSLVLTWPFETMPGVRSRSRRVVASRILERPAAPDGTLHLRRMLPCLTGGVGTVLDRAWVRCR